MSAMCACHGTHEFGMMSNRLKTIQFLVFGFAKINNYDLHELKCASVSPLAFVFQYFQLSFHVWKVHTLAQSRLVRPNVCWRCEALWRFDERSIRSISADKL